GERPFQRTAPRRGLDVLDGQDMLSIELLQGPGVTRSGSHESDVAARQPGERRPAGDVLGGEQLHVDAALPGNAGDALFPARRGNLAQLAGDGGHRNGYRTGFGGVRLAVRL